MSWYALRSKPNREEALWREIEARGHQAFYPHIRVRPVNPRARKVRPYFPGYLFVLVDLVLVGMKAFSRLHYSLGLVSFDDQPASVPEALLGAIRLRVDEINAAGGEGFDEQRKHGSRFKEGDKVVISEGPFAGYQAMFDAHLTGADRARVLLQLLQSRPVKLDLPVEQIELTNRR